MASPKHDFIVSTIARKIRKVGFDITYMDGRYKDVGKVKCEIPPKILNHRPDIIGQNAKGEFCIGEAKTINDLLSRRTANQIRDFLYIVSTHPENRLFLGIPLSARPVLTDLLAKLGFSAHRQLNVICVPDILLPGDENL